MLLILLTILLLVYRSRSISILLIAAIVGIAIVGFRQAERLMAHLDHLVSTALYLR